MKIMKLMFGKSCWTSINMRTSLLCFLTLVSCGRGYVEDDGIQEAISEGRYTAKINSLNVSMGRYSGWLNISIFENQFWARVKVDGPQSSQMHAQYIHINSTCPTMKDDLNHDGYLDFMEVYRVAGPILIPLDSNLNSQVKGLNDFPIMRRNSSFYYYSEASNSSWLMADLRRNDTYTDDMLTKLRPSESLNLSKRIIIIYGTKAERHFPESVSSFDGYPKQTSIPIACGEITEGEHNFSR